MIDVRRPRGGKHAANDELNDGSFIRIINIVKARSVPKPWDDIKDYFIPFLKRFVNEFGLSDNEIEIEIGLNKLDSERADIPKKFTLNDVFEDRVKLPFIMRTRYSITEVNWIKIIKK
jgi:hypothetical protein